jgi:hypothetical protein
MPSDFPRKRIEMTHTYRDTRASLVRRYHWPAREDPRYKDLEAQSWDEIRRVLLGFIGAWMTVEHAHITNLEEVLKDRAGVKWWNDEAIGVVEEFLNSI